ncbi:MAG: hypothetical protein ACPLIG_04720 [Candidatus Bathyarchaeales archaeon]
MSTLKLCPLTIGFTTRKEFMRAARWHLKLFRDNMEYVKVSRDKYERLEAALEEMDAPYLSVPYVINRQIEEVLEKYDR